jgi:hypothetical protein
MKSQSGEKKYYAATIILPLDKQEKRNAALRIKKGGYRSEIKTLSDNTTRQRYRTAETPENYRKVPELRKIKENTADIKYISYTTCGSYRHRGGSNNGTRHKILQNKGKFPEPDKLENFREIRETGSLANEQYNMK